jgi:hypothetical protein
MAREVRILHTTIAVPLTAAYEFAHQPANFAKWAAGLADTLHETADGWVAGTPEGEAAVRFSARNEHGVLDHWVELEGKPEIYIPLRMIANGDATEVELVLLRQPGMSDADFDRDAQKVAADLQALKALLEKG